MVDHRAEPFDSLFVALTHVGSFGVIWFTLAVLTVWLMRRPLAFPLVLVAYFVSAGATDLIKLAVERPRPLDHPLVREPTTYSFPSGHAATSFACAATLAWYGPRHAAPVLFVVAGAIAFSRVYVGVHYPLDVLAGAVLGLVVATALRLLPAGLQRSRRAPPAG